jgi:hypothetical protein
MFDGIDRLPMRRPVSPLPNAIDTHALLPLLRSRAAEAACTSLAHIVAANAEATLRWLRVNWGAGADVRDPGHPAHVAALDPASPAFRLAEAQEALVAALRRYRSTTGASALPRVRAAVECCYGAAIAEYALRPVERAEAMSARVVGLFSAGVSADSLTPAEFQVAVDDLLTVDEPPASEPTPEQQQRGRSAIAEWLLSSPELDGVNGALGRLLVVWNAEGGNAAAPAFTRAVDALHGAIDEVLAGGYDAACLQAILGYWAAATGGPQIAVVVD